MKRCIKNSRKVYDPVGDCIQRLLDSDCGFDEYCIEDAKVLNLGDGGFFLISEEPADGVNGMKLRAKPDLLGEEEVFEYVYNSWKD